MARDTRPSGVAWTFGRRLERRHALPGEVGEVQAQVVEERRPALLHLVEELLLPVGARAERAATTRSTHVPPDVASTRNSLTQRRDRRSGPGRRARPSPAPRRRSAGRVPAGDRALGGGLAHVEHDGAALALVDLGGHEPRADAVGGGDGIPHLLGRAGQLEGELDAQGDVGGGHGVSSGLGWAATTRRCGRPSSWW